MFAIEIQWWNLIQYLLFFLLQNVMNQAKKCVSKVGCGQHGQRFITATYLHRRWLWSITNHLACDSVRMRWALILLQTNVKWFLVAACALNSCAIQRAKKKNNMQQMARKKKLRKNVFYSGNAVYSAQRHAIESLWLKTNQNMLCTKQNHFNLQLLKLI